MQFPNEPTFAERLTLMTRTFSYRLGGATLLSTLFLFRDAPSSKVFGGIVAGWIVFEVLVKFFISKREK